MARRGSLQKSMSILYRSCLCEVLDEVMGEEERFHEGPRIAERLGKEVCGRRPGRAMRFDVAAFSLVTRLPSVNVGDDVSPYLP